MKGNKKLLVVAVLLLLVAVGFGTYAIYRETASGTGSLKAAAWSVKIDGTAVKDANFDFDINDINWTTHTGKNDTIAPGDSGTITIPVVATGSEVDVLVEAALGTSANLPDGFTVSLSGTNGVTEIPYGSTMEANIVVTVTWEGTLDDPSTKDTTDLTAQGSNLSIPINLTARQKLAND